MEEDDDSFKGCLAMLIYIGIIILALYLFLKYGSGSTFDGWTPDYP